jgi:hypothetical protein
VCVLDPGQGREAVDFEDLAGRVEIEFYQRPVDRVDPGVVHQQVHGAERRNGPHDGVGLMFEVVALACDSDRVVGAAERGDGLVQRLLLAGGDGDLRTVCDQPLGDGEPDAAARSRYYRDLAAEPITHKRACPASWP